VSPPGETRAAIGRAIDEALGHEHEPALRRLEAALAREGLLPEQAELALRYPRRRALFEELARRRLTALGTGLFVNGVVRAILQSAPDGVLLDWRRRFDAGEALGALAITKEECGGDLSRMNTCAERGEAHWTLTGGKYCVVNAAYADLTVVVAKNASASNPFAYELFAVPADAPGLSRGGLSSEGHRGTLGWLRLESVCVPAELRLVGPGGGLGLLYETLFDERVSIATRAVAMARVLLDETVEHCRRRHSFGEPLIGRQAVQFRLAELHAEVTATAEFVRAVATRPTEPARRAAESAMVKYEACRLFERVSDEAVQLFGGTGYLADSAAGAGLLDAVGLTLSGGSEEAMLATIAASEAPPKLARRVDPGGNPAATAGQPHPTRANA
jgi:alkylation response protein AidB-like acyl-CoA dehydrogenase